MSYTTNEIIVEKAIEITIAKVSCSDQYVNDKTGKDTADYLEAVYNKLVELYKKGESNIPTV